MLRTMNIQQRLRIHDVQLLSDDWYVLKKTRFDWRRRDGAWQTMSRETYDRGNGAVLLPYHGAQRTVILTRQFRYPAFVNGHHDLMVEAPAGLLDRQSTEDRVRAEVEEETGYRLHDVRPVFEAFMSPGSVTEKLHFFVGEYEAHMRVGDGGGVPGEGEDIEVIELTIDDALAQVADGRINDGKTIMLLQYAALHLFPRCKR
jgi:nudix-type nucleoside diphosphatase (YffH/AdpP family)